MSRVYYIAGPMTDLPEFNYPYFEKVAQQLRDQGMEIRSPHEHFKDSEEIQGEHPWYHYMTLGLKLLLDCTDIIMLHGWKDSRGASLERRVAESLGMAVWCYLRDTEKLVLVHRGTRPEHAGPEESHVDATERH